MERTYRGNKESAKGNFGINFTGDEALGCIMFAIDMHNLTVEDINKYKFLCFGGAVSHCTRFEMTESECSDAAQKLKALPEEARQKIFEQCQDCFYPATGKRDFDGLLKEWIDFLETCGGYTVD